MNSNARTLNTTAMLTAAGIEVRMKGQKELMHLKSYAIDGTCVRAGSANWSPTGLKRQDNDVRSALYAMRPGPDRCGTGALAIMNEERGNRCFRCKKCRSGSA